MSDQNNTLEILIKTLADLNGSDAVEKALARVKQTTTEHTTATKAQTEAQNDLSHAEEKGAEHANILHKNHQLVHKILHLIAHETGPAAGIALGAAGALAGGGIMLGVFAAKQLFELLHHLTEQANEFREMMESQIDLAPMVTEVSKVGEAMDTAREKTKQFFDDINRKANQPDGWKKIADAQIEQLKRVADEQKKLADAEAERDKAKLEFLKATKQITEEQYKAGLASISAMRENKKGGADNDLANQSTAVLEAALQGIESDKSKFGPQLGPANVRAEEAKQSLENLKKKLDTLSKLQAAHLDRITGGKDGKGLQQAYDDIVGFMDNLFGESKIYETAQLSEEDLKKAREEDQQKSFTKHSPDFWDKVKKAREILEKIAEERAAEAAAAATARDLKNKQPGALDEANTAQSEAKAIEDKVNQLIADQKAIEDELKKRRGEASAHNQFSGATAGAQTTKNAFEAATPKEADTTNNAAAQLLANQKVGQALAAAAAQAAKEHNGSVTAILAALQQIRQQNIILQERINSMGH